MLLIKLNRIIRHLALPASLALHLNSRMLAPVAKVGEVRHSLCNASLILDRVVRGRFASPVGLVSIDHFINVCVCVFVRIVSIYYYHQILSQHTDRARKQTSFN